MSQSSQMDLIEQVISWDKQTCLENVDTTLHKVISKLKECAYIEEGIGVLKVICNSLLPCVPSEEQEDRVFRKICKLACSFVDSSLNKILLNLKGSLKDTIEEVKSVVAECLEWMMDVVACIEICIKQVIGTSSSVELASVQSLPGCVLHVLKQAYNHCKDSSNMYGDLLECIADPLSSLFKKAHSLQVSFISLLEKVCITGAQLEEHVIILCSVCNGLFDICSIVTSLDVKLVISLWKGIARVSNQHLSLLRDRFDVCPLINFLCKEVDQGYQYIFQLYPGADPESLSQVDDKAFSKSVKILGFQMKVMVALLRDFQDYLGNCEENVLHLLLTLHRYIPPSLYAIKVPEKQEEEVKIQLVNATAPIIRHLVGSRVFRIGLTSLGERSSGDRLALLLLQLMVLDILPKYEADVIDHWLNPVNHSTTTPTRGLLAAIFHSVNQCELEMRVPVMLPGMMVFGKPLRQVSLYEHTATHICGYIGACQTQHFSILETALLENLVSNNNLSYLLAMDCWCFLVRYGTASVCNDHVQSLTQVYRQLIKDRTPAAQKISYRLQCLISRLIKFMCTEDQAALVNKYPPEKEPAFWVALTPKCLNGDLARNVGEQLVTWGLSVLHGNQGKTSEILQACELFNTMLCEGADKATCLSVQQQAVLLDAVSDMWEHIHATLNEKASRRVHLLCKLLPVTRSLLPTLETAVILKVLFSIQSHIKAQEGIDIALSTAHFLSGFGHLKIGPSFEQTQVLTWLSQVFHTLLTHPEPVVHHRALTTFTEYASHTIYEDTILACIQGNQALQDRVGKFLNKKPYQKNEFDVVGFLRGLMNERDQALLERGSTDSRMNPMEVDVSETNSCLEVLANAESPKNRPAKRTRLSSETTEIQSMSKDISTEDVNSTRSSSSVTVASNKYRTFLATLTSLASDLEGECSKPVPPPHWFVVGAREAVARIKDCISHNNGWFDNLS